MPGVRVYWLPFSDPDAARFDVYRQQPGEVAVVYLDVVPKANPGPNFQVSSGKFFYDDPTGSRESVYRVLAVTSEDTVVGDSGLFRPMDATGAPTARIPLDHNYGSADRYQATAPGGAPIAYLTIVVYKKTDYDAGGTPLPVGVTETDLNGRWQSPVFVEPGLDYVIVFQKLQAYGPLAVTVTVGPG